MQHGMLNAIELHRVEQELRDRALRYHYLVADAQPRERRSSWLAGVSASLHAFLAPRPVLREERGV